MPDWINTERFAKNLADLICPLKHMLTSEFQQNYSTRNQLGKNNFGMQEFGINYLSNNEITNQRGPGAK